jgi:hypothetical protein
MSEHGACPVLEGQKVCRSACIAIFISNPRRSTLTLNIVSLAQWAANLWTWYVLFCISRRYQHELNPNLTCMLCARRHSCVIFLGAHQDQVTPAVRSETRTRPIRKGLCPIPINRRCPKKIPERSWPPSRTAGPIPPRPTRPCTILTVTRKCFGEIWDTTIHRSPSTLTQLTFGASRWAKRCCRNGKSTIRLQRTQTL